MSTQYPSEACSKGMIMGEFNMAYHSYYDLKNYGADSDRIEKANTRMLKAFDALQALLGETESRTLFEKAYSSGIYDSIKEETEAWKIRILEPGRRPEQIVPVTEEVYQTLESIKAKAAENISSHKKGIFAGIIESILPLSILFPQDARRRQVQHDYTPE